MGRPKISETSLRASALMLLMASLICGCSLLPAVGPDFERPKTQVQERWSALLQHEKTVQAVPGSLSKWWDAFGDDALSRLVVQALTNSPDLLAAESRLREARAQVRVVGAQLLPDISSSASFSRFERGSSSFGTGAADGTSAVPSFGSASGAGELYDAGFDALWEIDIFGGLRREKEAAQAGYFAAAEALHNVQLSLAAEVSRNYVELRAAEKKLAIARKNIALQSETLELVDARFRAGLTSELDVAQARALLEETRARVPALETARDRALYGLAVLTGMQPLALTETLPADPVRWDTVNQILAQPALVPLGLPTELLQRRPDIRRAEHELHAATALIGVARSDLFPRFTLTGAFGFQAREGGDLLDADSSYWSFAPGIRWPIFAGGRILANIDVQTERQFQAVQAYERTVLGALSETETALSAFQNEKKSFDSLVQALASERRALEISQELYSKGLTDFLDVLQAQRSLYAVEEALAESESEALLLVISLYKALGGGWSDAQPRGLKTVLSR